MSAPGDATVLAAMANRAVAAARAEGWSVVRTVIDPAELGPLVVGLTGTGTPEQAVERYAMALGFAGEPATAPGVASRWLLVPWCDIPYTRPPVATMAHTKPSRSRGFSVSYAKLDRHQLAVTLPPPVPLAQAPAQAPAQEESRAAAPIVDPLP